MVRLGVVESILTPVTVSPQHRPNSYSGETTNNNESREQLDLPTSSRTTGISSEAINARTLSTTLYPPVSRSSYMTTSTASRMSGLSDFPVPPTGKDHRLSLSAYFNEPLPPPFTEQLSLGNNNQDAVVDLAKRSTSSL
jgi:serine/arginine repetitive matrix protein 2